MKRKNQIVEVLDNFDVNRVNDYLRLPPKDKPYFVRRLYKACDSESKLLDVELQHLGGAKFHFAASVGNRNPGHNVPTSAFLNKLLFYSNKTLITFPFNTITHLGTLGERTEWAAYQRHQKNQSLMLFGEFTTTGGNIGTTGKNYAIDPDSFKRLVQLLLKLKPALSSGVVHVLPNFPDIDTLTYNEKHGLVSANFQLKSLKQQFDEILLKPSMGRRSRLGLTQLLLPHFERVPLERVLEIRLKEQELYWEFQRRLESLFHGASQMERESTLLALMKETDEGVRELHRKFLEIRKNYRRKNIYMLVKFISAGLVLFAPIEAKETITSLLGGLSAFEYLTSHEEYARERYKTRNNKFYLPWLVFRSAK